ncbi:MAG: HAMP domain-containing protein, partial [Rhodobacteraceae bacterium]|nr:HAMP domain-containing protein [Paracoccaceae bacterium]
MRLPLSSNISFKLPAIIMAMVAAAVGIANALAYFQQRTSLQEGAQDLLQAVATARGTRIEEMLKTNANDLSITANRASTFRAIKGFTRAWKVMGQGQMETLQRLYISDNPYPAGAKQNLDTAEDDSTCTTVHAQAHPEFRAIQQLYGYYDVFLFDIEGNLIYSVFKEADFATNMNDGEWAQTGLASAYRAALELAQNQFAFEDYAPYGPSNGSPASFIAQSVFSKSGDRVGVLAYQLPSGHVSSIANMPEGLGETGEVTVIGPDHLVRTNSRFRDEDMILKRELNNEVTLAALQGKSGVAETRGRDGQLVTSAYFPLDIFGQRWALIAERDQAEIYADTDRLLLLLAGSSAVVILLVSGLGVIFARSMTRPLKRAAISMENIAAGAYDEEISGTDRGDEIGVITTKLEKIRNRLV